MRRLALPLAVLVGLVFLAACAWAGDACRRHGYFQAEPARATVLFKGQATA